MADKYKPKNDYSDFQPHQPTTPLGGRDNREVKTPQDRRDRLGTYARDITPEEWYGHEGPEHVTVGRKQGFYLPRSVWHPPDADAHESVKGSPRDIVNEEYAQPRHADTSGADEWHMKIEPGVYTSREDPYEYSRDEAGKVKARKKGDGEWTPVTDGAALADIYERMKFQLADTTDGPGYRRRDLETPPTMQERRKQAARAAIRKDEGGK